ncbi:magnesium and cobalt transport protein cora [hydrocarbon metagenome]|uniref:Magnesium and cobalt transport protein cora n=1 Tax=hydrocarbon metagenome TaxID=938273 RepID=A0A0W8FFL7_9ZZZZ
MVKRSAKAGMPPGTLVHIGERRREDVTIIVIGYDRDRFEEFACRNPEDAFSCLDRPGVTWINVDGLHDTGIIRALCDHAGIHPLTQEDIAHTGQRPKLEDYGDYLYIVIRMFSFEDGSIRQEQVSIVLGETRVISFQEQRGDVFSPVRERLRQNRGRIRAAGADYLTYALLDALVDAYFPILEELGNRVEALEAMALAEPGSGITEGIYGLKRELRTLRQSIWPLREVVSAFARGDSNLIREPTLVYLRDVYDHAMQVAETVEIYRDTVAGVLELHLFEASRRMNEVIKVLTIIATIFIPLTFIAGVYGMNFAFMPELEQPLGYPAVLLGMLAVALVMLAFFRKRRWI